MVGWIDGMRQLTTIATNAFMELIRQPIFLLLMTSSAIFVVYLASLPYFGFGDDPKLVKDSVLAVMLLVGLLGAVLSASNTVAREIHAGTALAVLANVNLLAVLLASRMAYDAYGSTDWIGLAIFCGAVLLAYAMGGFSNFFL